MTRKLFPTLLLLAALLLCAPSGDLGAAATVEGAVREYIEAQMPWPPGTARVDFLSARGDKSPLEGGVTLRVENAGPPDFIGDAAFLVRHYRAGNLLRTETVRTRIEVMRDVVVTAKTLATGTVLNQGDFQLSRRWVRRVHPQALVSGEEAAGRRLAVQLAAGAEILASMLKEVPLVRRGQMVKIILERGAMRIMTVGLPEEDGVAGSIVRVRNITSNRIIYARVLGDSLVGIEF